jgi:hypothetical protein
MDRSPFEAGLACLFTTFFWLINRAGKIKLNIEALIIKLTSPRPSPIPMDCRTSHENPLFSPPLFALCLPYLS